MKAMILAAGTGSRLKGLTSGTPKALVQAGRASLLEHLILKMISHGVTEIVINVHHLADQIITFLSQKEDFGISISISDERAQLLDTGGGLLHARRFLDGRDPFILHNVDIVSDIDLRQLYNTHLQQGGLVTLAVRQRNTSRYLLFDGEMHLGGWENIKTGERIKCTGNECTLTPYAFSGIHVISPEIFPLIKESGSFSIIDTYLRLCRDHTIKGYEHAEGYWIDAGKPEGLLKAGQLLDGEFDGQP